jgi:Tfp pilus assembly protein PilO
MTAIKLPSFIKKQPVAVVCALVCVGLVAAIYFRRSSLAEANDVLAQKKSDGEHLTDNVTSASRLDEQLAAMTQAIQAIEARLVHADQLAINKQYFYKIESETQTKLTNLSQSGLVSWSKNPGKTAYVAVAYSINVDGTYSQLLDFVRRVENGGHFSRVQGLTLSHAAGNENAAKGPTIISLSLNLELLGLP